MIKLNSEQTNPDQIAVIFDGPENTTFAVWADEVVHFEDGSTGVKAQDDDGLQLIIALDCAGVLHKFGADGETLYGAEANAQR